MKHLELLQSVALEDVEKLKEAAKSYGDSWLKRGGVGAYMMLARKMDRMELQVKKKAYDIFQAIADDTRPEGIIDDIRDLRRYLLLVECEARLHVPAICTEQNLEAFKQAFKTGKESVGVRSQIGVLEADTPAVKEAKEALNRAYDGMENPRGFDPKEDA